jgi:hypothetical protein
METELAKKDVAVSKAQLEVAKAQHQNELLEIQKNMSA